MAKAKRFKQNEGNTAICYYRYSSDAQRDVSIDQQRQAAHEYAKVHGYHIIREYEDRAISGTTNRRPGYSKMLKEASILRPAVLIIWKTDRLSRDELDIDVAKAILREAGVEIEYVAEAIPKDNAFTRILMEKIHEALASGFIPQHSENVMRGLTFNAERALYNGVPVIGYKGIPDNPYIIDETTAPIVKQIFEDYASGIPMQKIVNGLKAKGIKTMLGNEFNVNSIRRILTNRSYTGIYKWGDFIIPDGMPRIISDELFNRVQKRLESNKRGGKGALRLVSDEDINDYWLSGHIYCACCGSSMHGLSGTSKTGKKFYYYACKNSRRKKCSMKNIHKDVLEKVVFKVLQEVTQDPTNRLLLAQQCYDYYQSENDTNGAVEECIKKQLKETEKKIANILKAIEEGVVTETTVTRLKELEAEKSEQQDILITEQNRIKNALQLKDIARWLDSFAGDLSDETNRNRILEDYLDKIFVSPDKAVITFTYTDQERVLPIQETSSQIESEQRIMDLLSQDNCIYTIPTKLLESLLNPIEEPQPFF